MNLLTAVRTAALCLPLSLSAQSGFDVALIGDVPYGAAAEPRYENMIADINKSGADMTFHIGDTKSGSTRCDNTHYTKTLSYFNSFDKPVIYSVGDNEWTDCMRTNNGGFDPLERLALVRKTYFSTNMSLGRRPIALQRQSEDPKYALYVENSMLVKAPAVFVTIHMPGSNNNLQYKLNQGVANTFYDPEDKEYTARNAANLAWLSKAFQTAKATNSLGIMILVQANVFEAFMETTTGNTKSGFREFVSLLREETNKFKGEVVMVNGDTHYMRVDKPLTAQFPACLSATGDCKPFEAAPDARGPRVLNFTRAEVPGSGDVHWMICHVRPNSRNIFQFEFMIMPTAVAPAGVTAVVIGPGVPVTENLYETGSSQIGLDGSKSLSSNSGDLTYSWRNAPGYPPAGIVNADTATPLIQFGFRGLYQFTLTVTDRTGGSASSTVSVRYY